LSRRPSIRSITRSPPLSAHTEAEMSIELTKQDFQAIHGATPYGIVFRLPNVSC
jgi:hypothetical protein